MPSLSLPSSHLGALSRDVLRSASQIKIRAPGTSMLPTIQHNDTLIVDPTDIPIREGDILLFQADAGRLIAHRAVKIDPLRGYLMRGDANRACDGWIDAVQVVGRVTSIERGGRRMRINRLPYAIYRFGLIFHRRLARLRYALHRCI